MQLGIKNKLLFHPAKLNNIIDINLNNGDNYLTIIFDNEKYEKTFKCIRNKIKKNKFDEHSREYNVIKFITDDILKYGCTININTVTIMIKSVFKDDSYYYIIILKFI